MTKWKISRIGDLVLEVSSEELKTVSDYMQVERYILGSNRFSDIQEFVHTSTAMAMILGSDHIGLSDLESFLDDFDLQTDQNQPPEMVMEVPVCYDPDFGPDQETLSRKLSLPIGEIISLHHHTMYEVEMFGFIPGFAYLTGLPDVLKVKRKEVPSTSVPGGSVAIVEEKSAVYPLDSPGGWYIIGKTPLKMVDFSLSVPFKLKLGSRVKFTPITREQFEVYHD